MVLPGTICAPIVCLLAVAHGPPPARDFTASEAPREAIWLDSLDIRSVEQETGVAQAGKSVEKKPILLDGTSYVHGIGTHSHSEMEIDLHGAAVQFRSMVGVDDEAHGKGSVNFEVWGDD